MSIGLDDKPSGERSAGNPLSPFEITGTRDGLTVRIMRRSQSVEKGEQQIGRAYGVPRQSSTLQEKSKSWKSALRLESQGLQMPAGGIA